MSKDSHTFWHVVETCPTPGGHHEGAGLLQAAFLSPVPKRRGNSPFAAILRGAPRCWGREGLGLHRGWEQGGPQRSVARGGCRLPWIPPVSH